MNRMAFVWVLYESVPRGGADRTGDAIAMAERLERLLDALMAFPDARVAIHLTGGTLEWLWSHRGATMDALGAVVRSGRVELLGGTEHGAVFSSIPRQDLVSQVRHAARLIAEVTGGRPHGFWVPLGVWEGDIPAVLTREGFRHTFLDSNQLQVPPGRVRPAEGHWIVERLGYALTVFSLDPHLGRACGTGDSSRVQDALVEKIRTGAALASAAFPLERVGRASEGRVEVEAVFSVCRDLAHRVNMVLPVAAGSACPPSGVVRTPVRMVREVAERSVPPEVVTQGSKKRGGRRRRTRMTSDWSGAASWDWFLDRYPEANYLHKKMLWMSGWMGRLRRLLRQRMDAGEDPSVLMDAMERARNALFLAQAHAAYWPAPSGGIYDPQVRHAALERVITVQRIVEAVFFPEARYVSHQQVDLDRDGRLEVLSSTPTLDAGVSVTGGALFELAYKPVPVSLVWPLGRRRELEHGRLAGDGVGPPLRGKGEEPGMGVKEAVPGEFRDRLRYDRYLRWCFLDHFLGADTTVDNFYQCRYPEIGDFVSGAYEVIRVGYERRAGRGEVHLGRNGHVGELNDRKLKPIRVEKTYIFDDRAPRLEVRYDITNRGPTPVSVTFAPELSFSWPVQGIGLGGAPGEEDVWHRFGESPGPAVPGSLDAASLLALSVPGKNLELRVVLDEPAAWWWFPVETVDGREEPRVRTQGSVFLPRWELALWGEETKSYRVVLELHDPGEAPSSVDIVDEGEEESTSG